MKITINRIGFARSNNTWVMFAEGSTVEIAKKKLARLLAQKSEQEAQAITKNYQLVITSYERDAA